MSPAPERARPALPLLGWREWVELCDFDVRWVKAKVDTGARSSSLHASDLETFERDGVRWVRFGVHPWQGSDQDADTVEAPIHDERTVRSSSGDEQQRIVIRSVVGIGDARHEVDLTLTRRDDMGFRMLLGREAVRSRYLVDPGRSYLSGRPPKSIRSKNRETD